MQLVIWVKREHKLILMKKMFKDKTLIIKILIFINCRKQEKRLHLLGKIY